MLWDIDGTLIRAGGGAKVALELAFEEILGVKEVWQNLNPDGRTDEWIFEELHIKRFGAPLPSALKSTLFDAYLHHLEIQLPQSKHYQVLPHALDVLNEVALDPRNVLGLATGNFEKAAYLKLKQGNLDHFFSFGGFGSDSIHRNILTKKALERACDKIGCDPHEVFVIGDTIYDVQCGKEIGAQTVAVCTGSSTREDLEQSRPDFLINDLSELKSFFK